MDSPFFVLIKLYGLFVGIVVVANIIAACWTLVLSHRIVVNNRKHLDI